MVHSRFDRLCLYGACRGRGLLGHRHLHLHRCVEVLGLALGPRLVHLREESVHELLERL